jgi:phytoene dehydrogenase-like protein
MKGERAIIVGAGLAGLTAGAYLARAGLKPLILEKGRSCGGLVQSFERDGFTFDAGPRAIGNSGILRPMLDELGISLPMADGTVSMGIEGETVHFDSEGGVAAWLSALGRLFPGSGGAIEALKPMIRSACRMASVLKRLPNPIFKNPLADPGYLLRRFLPWLPSFLGVALKTGADRRSIEALLAALSADVSFNDMVSQHFFKGTPWHFALGYFDNFRDYLYPLGGTGHLPLALEAAVREGGGRIETGREVMEIRPASRCLIDSSGEVHSYRELLWASDLRSLYARLAEDGLSALDVARIDRERRAYSAVRPAESVLSLFLAVDEAPESFSRVSRGHFIYTPKKDGLGRLHRGRLEGMKADFGSLDMAELRDWVEGLCEHSSYEISIPALRDPALAPAGQTGLCVSILCDGEFWELARGRGVEKELEETAAQAMLDALERSIYPGLRSKLLFKISATPLTIGSRVGTAGGAITGWSLEDPPPVPSRLTDVLSCARTAIPHAWKAGQWSYSPSGAPVAILTGRIAAGAMMKRLGAARVRRP